MRVRGAEGRNGKAVSERNIGKEIVYRGEIIYDVKGPVCFVLEFALTPFSPPLSYMLQFSKHNIY